MVKKKSYKDTASYKQMVKNNKTFMKMERERQASIKKMAKIRAKIKR